MKKIISFVLCVCCLCSFFCVPTYAEENNDFQSQLSEMIRKYEEDDYFSVMSVKIGESEINIDGETVPIDDALLFSTERSMAIFANDDTFFKGNWYVFDAETGKKVEGVTGTQVYAVTAYGNYIKYTTDDSEKKCVNSKGEALPEEAELLDDG